VHGEATLCEHTADGECDRRFPRSSNCDIAAANHRDRRTPSWPCNASRSSASHNRRDRGK
jgi:hypothetical protein